MPGMPTSRFLSYRTPTSGSDEIKSFVYGCRGDSTIVSADAFSARWPAYMTRIVSATCDRIEMSCVITIMLLTKPCVRNSPSIPATAFCVDTSSAEVISSAISSDGFRSVEMTITVRCFMPPESSIGYIPSTSSESPTSSSRRTSSSSMLVYATPRERSSSCVMRPIFRVGLSALIAYCGITEICLKRCSFISSKSQIGSSTPSSSTVPWTYFMRPVR